MKNDTQLINCEYSEFFFLIFFFCIRDILTEQLKPHQIDFGHLSENPNGWEERYERKNLKSQRYQGKV